MALARSVGNIVATMSSIYSSPGVAVLEMRAEFGIGGGIVVEEISLEKWNALQVA
jgi:hypothetical protein